MTDLASTARFTFEDLIESALDLDATDAQVVTEWRRLHGIYMASEKRAEILGLVGVGVMTYADNALTIAYNTSPIKLVGLTTKGQVI
tara:strand:+ start:266 stop:526 length:261 start_codon:yes stop_codon:yes gene_type:complete